jgi:hypothetical protein
MASLFRRLVSLVFCGLSWLHQFLLSLFLHVGLNLLNGISHKLFFLVGHSIGLDVGSVVLRVSGNVVSFAAAPVREVLFVLFGLRLSARWVLGVSLHITYIVC